MDYQPDPGAAAPDGLAPQEVPQVPDFVPETVVQPEPQATIEAVAPAPDFSPASTYAPQPQIPEEPVSFSPQEAVEPTPPAFEFVPEAPVAPEAQVTEAPPTQELYSQPMPLNTQFQNMPPVQPYAAPVEPPKNPFMAFWGRYKKMIIIAGSSVVVLALLGVGGFFGYRYYTLSTNAKILVKAGENLANSKEMSTKATIGVDAFSVTAKLDVDKDQDIRLTLDNSAMPITALYLQKKDTLYIKDFMSSIFGDGSSTTDTSKDYLAYTNVKKAMEVASQTYVNLKDVNPKNNYFTPDNMKFIKREADESVGGKGLYKFTFTPSKDFLDKLIADMKNDKTSSLGYDISNTSLNASIWIDKSSLQVQKIEGDVAVTIKYSGDPGYSTMSDSSFKLHWSEEFTYNMKEDIKLPSGSKVTTTTDLNTLVGDVSKASGGAQAKADDAKNKSIAHEIQNALEQYYVDNNVYPNVNDISGLKQALVSANLLSESTETTGISYRPSGSVYELSFVLANQDDSGDNVSGNSPNKIYTVTNMQ